MKLELANSYAKYYNLLDSIDEKRPIYGRDSLNGTEISEDLFFELCKIQYIGWKHRVDFKRSLKSSISDIFQDIIALFLRASLPKKYEVFLERKIDKIQPDILIEKDTVNHFAIELKTTVGWGRIDSRNEKTFEPYMERVQSIEEKFGIPQKNIIYIFAGVGNNGHGFMERYWDKVKNKRKEQPSQEPYKIIYPLFIQFDPYYLDWPGLKNKEKDKRYIALDDNMIRKYAKPNIVTPFEDIVKMIMK